MSHYYSARYFYVEIRPLSARCCPKHSLREKALPFHSRSARSLFPEGETFEFGYSREGDFHWNEPASGRYRVGLAHRYVYASSERAERERAECAYEIYSRYSVGNAPPTTPVPQLPSLPPSNVLSRPPVPRSVEFPRASRLSPGRVSISF